MPLHSLKQNDSKPTMLNTISKTFIYYDFFYEWLKGDGQNNINSVFFKAVWENMFLKTWKPERCELEQNDRKSDMVTRISITLIY